MTPVVPEGPVWFLPSKMFAVNMHINTLNVSFIYPNHKL